MPSGRPRRETTQIQLNVDLNLGVNEGTKDERKLLKDHWWCWKFDTKKKTEKAQTPDEYLVLLKPEREKVQKCLIGIRQEVFHLLESDTYKRFIGEQTEKYKAKGKTYNATSLEVVLDNSDSETRKKFWKYCEKEFSAENLACYELLKTIEDVDDFEFWLSAKKTYVNYVGPCDVRATYESGGAAPRPEANISSRHKKHMRELAGLIHVEEAAAWAGREFGPSVSSAQATSPKVTKKGK